MKAVNIAMILQDRHHPTTFRKFSTLAPDHAPSPIHNSEVSQGHLYPKEDVGASLRRKQTQEKHEPYRRVPDPSSEHDDNVVKPDGDSREADQDRSLSKVIKPASFRGVPRNENDAILQSLVEAHGDREERYGCVATGKDKGCDYYACCEDLCC
jgi:hypothetical protein